jgi:hypothetical protein
MRFASIARFAAASSAGSLRHFAESRRRRPAGGFVSKVEPHRFADRLAAPRDAEHPPALPQQMLAKMAADDPGGARDQRDPHHGMGLPS